MLIAREIIYYAALLAVLVALLLELRHDLTMLQQNSYRNERLRRWMADSHASTGVLRLIALVVVFVSLSTRFSTPWFAMLLILVVSVVAIAGQRRVKYKKPLVFTARARRIYCVQCLLSLACLVAAFFLFDTPGTMLHHVRVVSVTALALYCASYVVTLLANTLLAPVENAINRRYVDDARRRLASMPGLKVVGITGSYGKTSVKHYLHRILSEEYETLMTPGNYNTTLGVVRTVREHLKPYHEIFVCEMGARQPHDIAEICGLVHPQTGIITAVGPQHLETFGTLEAVRDTKFELADALPADGLAVVNDDFEAAARRPVDNVECIRYSARHQATDIECSPRGTSFTFEGHRYRTRLLGEAAVANLLAAIITARHLGVPQAKIERAVAEIEPVEHRLSLKTTPGGINIIDDAYNSNPEGSRMALEALSRFTGGRRIVVTPGMVELGDRQQELNRALGRHIAAGADIAIIVNEYNRADILAGIEEGEGNPEVHTVDTFARAQQLLNTMMRPGDTILYENDLPDTFK